MSVKVYGDLSCSSGTGTITVKSGALTGGGDVTATVTVKKSLDLNSGLVLHLDFEENLDDSSGNGNNSAAMGSFSYVDGVYYDKAVQFGGINNPGCLRVPNSTSLHFNQEVTVSFFVRLDSERSGDENHNPIAQGKHCLFAKDNDQSGRIYSILNTSNRIMSISSGGSSVSAGSGYILSTAPSTTSGSIAGRCRKRKWGNSSPAPVPSR